MTRIAFYLRYSCDKQSETSIDDQLRRCQQIAKRLGLSTENALVFADGALSASGKDDTKRTEYQKLLVAWENNEFTVLLVDEWSRLTRDGVEHALIVRRLEQNRRVRLISDDGVDTQNPNWQLTVSLLGMVGQQSTRDTQHRVGRGMVGQLERGYMVAVPAYGYDLKREHDATGKSIGSHWVINDATAAVVREIYDRRAAGQSMHQIAIWLNDAGMRTSSAPRKKGSLYWRPARIRNLLSNPVYRGEFVWHGSATYQNRANKQGIIIETIAYARPQLRLVSDETWYRCNIGRSISRSGYGGGKHALSGLLTCGCCGSTLVLSSMSPRRSLYCANCTEAKASHGDTDRQTVTVATVGIELLLAQALRHFLTPAFIESFRASLRLKLTGDTRHEVEQVRKRLGKLEAQQERYSRLVADDPEDGVMEKRYVETRQQVRQTQARLHTLEAGQTKLDEHAMEAQLAVDPSGLLETLFDADIPPEKLRTVLSRLFPSIVFAGKRGRYTSFFRIEFAAGAALSLVSGTATVDMDAFPQCFELRYTPDNRSETGKKWSVTPIEAAQMPRQQEKRKQESVSKATRLIPMAATT